MNLRLELIDVETCSGNLSILERFSKCGLVYHWTSGSIHQDGGLLHHAQRLSIDQMAGAWKQGHVKADEVGFAEDRLPVAKRQAILFLDFRFGTDLVVVNHL